MRSSFLVSGRETSLNGLFILQVSFFIDSLRVIGVVVVVVASLGGGGGSKVAIRKRKHIMTAPLSLLQFDYEIYISEF